MFGQICQNETFQKKELVADEITRDICVTYMFYHVNDQYSEMFMNINNTSRYVQAVYTDTCDVKMFFSSKKVLVHLLLLGL